MAETIVRFYTTSRDAWSAQLADIASAKKAIDFEQYIFMPDTIGRQFIDLFLQKASEGLKIRLLFDMVGSHPFYRSVWPGRLRSAGIEVRFFNPVSLWRIGNFSSSFFRDHRKIAIIDNDAIAYLGGVGVKDDMADWRDTHMRCTGELVPDITDSFNELWENTKKRLMFQLRDSPFPVASFHVLGNAPGFHRRSIHHALIRQIRSAKKFIYLTTPYFIPDVRTLTALRRAARRGIDVRLMVPTVFEYYLIGYARESYYTLTLSAGIRIYLYDASRMMHAKTAVIDDRWATAGSYNLDNLSAVFNHEINIASTSPAFVAELKNHFLEDISHSQELQYKEWIRRPFAKKCLEFLTWPLHSLL
jgi:cardiolipin synthase